MYAYNFNKDVCWYKNVCNQYNTVSCNSSCIRYQEIDFLMQNSNLPRNRQYPATLTATDKDLQAFILLQSIKDDIVNFTENGEGLYIFSPFFGNGKTTWAIKLLLSYFNKIWAGNGFRSRGLFIHVPTFLAKLKTSFNFQDEEFELLKKRLSVVDLVVWDDIAATKLTDYDHSNLLAFIDQRQLYQKANIYTGNLTQSQLPGALGNRLTSRIWNNSTTVQFVSQDRRGGII